MLHIANKTWEIVEEYPDELVLHSAAVLYFHGGFFYFGGTNGNKDIARVARLDSETYTWNKLGMLSTARKTHNVIEVSGVFLIIGGDATSLKTERCVYDNLTINCTEQDPTLDNYGNFPELFKASSDYCPAV